MRCFISTLFPVNHCFQCALYLRFDSRDIFVWNICGVPVIEGFLINHYLFWIAAMWTRFHAHDFVIVSKQSQMLPHLVWLDIMQALPVLSSAGDKSLFQIKMVLSWVIQLPTERYYLVGLHKQGMSLRQQIIPHWAVSTNTLTTASQCLRQRQREGEIKVHLLWSSQMKTVSLWLQSSLISFIICSFCWYQYW